MVKSVRRLLCAVWVAAILPAGLSALPVRVAFTSIDNLSANPRYDYLEGIIRGLLLYDLSEADGIEVVNRADLDDILHEQELQLSNLSEDQAKAVEVGRILGADYLLRGEYVFLGADVLVTIRLLDVGSARTLTFSERGSSENTLHAVAEAAILRLTGREVSLQSPQRQRSIISLQDEKPGAVALFCNLVDAEILLDGQFVGYTTGDPRVPFEIQDLSVGSHLVRVHLQDFGVVREPEITFHDWEQWVEVPAGKRVVVRAQIRHFNDTLYRLTRLLREEIDARELAAADRVSRTYDASFVDRQGNPVAVLVQVDAESRGDAIDARAVVTYQGKEHSFVLSGTADEDKEVEERIGKISFTLELDSGELSCQVWRTDIQQNMFREGR
jgi:TolB-like protein